MTLAARERFDDILMDLQMPVMAGLAAAREIRRGPSAPNLPILVMTANALAGDRELCLAALETLFQEDAPVPGTETAAAESGTAMDVDWVKAVIAELDRLVADGDSEALVLVGEFKDLLGPGNITDTVRELESRIDDYEFERARETIRRIISELNLDD
ncbi:MAG: response regulator [Thermodesulfobacteriota bacterium]